ncbi:hypothetical protein TSAR_004012 [Trichomalopsis sarcophagae]|uniref:Uncharacterized protein n=1 Tax=Trichomalopsis sarcophagae TaxID=543379 RepID=A0A232EKY6_9HYME|nr:hypothetical protein TSAR_004012 [Trichomalopsis sarcophagae]
MSRVYTRHGFRITIRRRVESAMRWRPWRDDRVSALQARGSRFKPGVCHFFVALFIRNNQHFSLYDEVTGKVVEMERD